MPPRSCGNLNIPPTVIANAHMFPRPIIKEVKIKSMEANPTDAEKQRRAFNHRSEIVETIISSSSNKKVVVAGPGTGKTFLFNKILIGKGNSLTLTFVNSLVDDLSLELCGLSDVKTLHSFARTLLSKVSGKTIRIYAKLTEIIKEDSQILLGLNADFKSIFNQRREEEKDLLQFYRKRRGYYGYYGFSDIVYTAILLFEQNKTCIPSYDQIVVDEFQDFNKLEVDLIDLLAEKSPILLAGDDDQALYCFKSASNQYIRDRNNDMTKGYTSFNLPYCARCPKVVVDATNDFIESAKSEGFLNGRIDKPFIYFDDEDKDIISRNYPSIGYVNYFCDQIPWFIETKILEMASEAKASFSVLIISPYKKQTRAICNGLKKRGLQNIDYNEKKDDEITIFDGIKMLLEDRNDPLGWRIVLQFVCSSKELKVIIEKTDKEPSRHISEIISLDQKRRVKKLIASVNYIKKNREINEDYWEDFLSILSLDPKVITKNHVKMELDSINRSFGNHSIKKIPIKATTIQSAKGLSADLVFITHLDDQYFITDPDKSKISDQDICNFLVSISRTKKKLYLISTVPKHPTFLNWISKERIEVLA